MIKVKNIQVPELAEAWGLHFARAYAEFIRALSEPETPSLRQSAARPTTTKGSSRATSRVVEEVSATDDPQATARADAAHEAHLAAARKGVARTVEFDSAVPAKSVGNRLKEIFKQRGIKQSEIAERLGVAPSAISRVFKHPERSRLQTIRNIAEAAGIAIGELI